MSGKDKQKLREYLSSSIVKQKKCHSKKLNFFVYSIKFE